MRISPARPSTRRERSRQASGCAEVLFDDQPLVERLALCADDLIALVSLAGEQHEIFGAGVLERVTDRLTCSSVHTKGGFTRREGSRQASRCAEVLSDDQPLVERLALGADDLIPLVSLAREQHEVL